MSEPPKLAEALLRSLVGGRDTDAVVGDLRETFDEHGGGRLWYWGQVLSCLAVRFSLYRRALPGIGTDFSCAVRRIRRNPGYAVTATLCLALALGVNTTLFSFLDGLYFRKLPVPDADRIVQITRDGGSFCRLGSFRGFGDKLLSIHAAAISGFFDSMDVDRTGYDIVIEGVSANYPQVLRLGTALGTWFRAEADDMPEVVISYHLWQTRFAGDPNVLGRQVGMLMRTCRVVGVASRDFTGTRSPLLVDAWIPLVSADHRMNLIGRLTPGATLASATAEMAVVNAQLRAADPGNEEFKDPIRVDAASGFLRAGSRESFLPIVKLLSAVSIMVLLIACVNVANLLLSRAAVRQREMAIRQSLGASRARLFRETLAEGLVLAAFGLILGTAFGYWTGYALELAMPSVPNALYRGLRLGIDWRVALFLALAGVLSAILFSLPPALANIRRPLSPAMKGGDIRHSRQREIYSVAQWRYRSHS
ncbi:MAG: ABC transporter permease [Ignavibacteriota bacterium]